MAYVEAQHPRDYRGRWIEKIGGVDVFGSPSSLMGENHRIVATNNKAVFWEDGGPSHDEVMQTILGYGTDDQARAESAGIVVGHYRADTNELDVHGSPQAGETTLKQLTETYPDVTAITWNGTERFEKQLAPGGSSGEEAAANDIGPGEYEKLNTDPDWIAQTEKKPYYHATADVEVGWDIEDNGFAGNDVLGMEGVVFLSDEPLGGFEQGLDATPGWVEVQVPIQWQPAGKYDGSEWDDQQYGTDNVAFPARLLNLLPRRAMDAADLGASGHKVKTEHLEGN